MHEKRQKGIVITTEMLVIVVFLVVGAFLFIVIYSTFVGNSADPINVFTNRLLDSLIGKLS